MLSKQHNAAERKARKAVEKVFQAAEEIVAAKREWERAERKADREANANTKGKKARSVEARRNKNKG